MEAIGFAVGTIAVIDGWNIQPDYNGRHHTGRWVWDTNPSRWWPEYEGDTTCGYPTDVYLSTEEES